MGGDIGNPLAVNVNLARIPQSLVVVGAGVIGMEYASMFAAVGTKVTVIDTRRDLLPFCDSEIVEALKYKARPISDAWKSKLDSETARLIEQITEP